MVYGLFDPLALNIALQTMRVELQIALRYDSDTIIDPGSTFRWRTRGEMSYKMGCSQLLSSKTEYEA